MALAGKKKGWGRAADGPLDLEPCSRPCHAVFASLGKLETDDPLPPSFWIHTQYSSPSLGYM